MEKKMYEVIMVIECEEGAQKYIAQSVCDGLEEPTCVKFINIKQAGGGDILSFSDTKNK
jgi:hypothetical protein